VFNMVFVHGLMFVLHVVYGFSLLFYIDLIFVIVFCIVVVLFLVVFLYCFLKCFVLFYIVFIFQVQLFIPPAVP